MSNDHNDMIEALTNKLKSATRKKLNAEKTACEARIKECCINEQLNTVRAEIVFAKERLEDLKTQISRVKHQISIIAICSASEKTKFEAHITNLELHKKGFQELFDEEQLLFDLRMKEVQNKEAEEEEEQRRREKEIAEQSERDLKEADIINFDCEALEKECNVLKKRNNAIMLQLRRKLLEAESARRERAKRNV